MPLVCIAMSEIEGIYRDGHVELNAAVSWPDGIHVVVQPQLAADERPGSWLPTVQSPGGKILPWSDTPEFRAALVAQMDHREAVELTPAEEAEWRAARDWMKNHTLAAVRREMGFEA